MTARVLGSGPVEHTPHARGSTVSSLEPGSSTSLYPARLGGGRRSVLSCEGCRAAHFRWRADGLRLPGSGRRKTGRGSTADPLGVQSRGIATVGLGVSWAAWAHGHGHHGQNMGSNRSAKAVWRSDNWAVDA